MDDLNGLDSNDILDWLMMDEGEALGGVDFLSNMPSDKIMNLLSSTDHTLTTDDQAFLKEQLFTSSKNIIMNSSKGTNGMRSSTAVGTSFQKGSVGGSLDGGEWSNENESEKEETSKDKKKRKLSDNIDPSAMKKIRQEKNRECARESRRRKKELLDTLEATIKELKEENASLKKQIKLGTSGDSEGEKEEQEKWEITRGLQKMIEKGSNDQEIASIIKEFGAKYADYGEGRYIKVEHHLKQIHKLLIPTETTKMAIWTLHQEDDFYKEDTDPLSLMTGGSTIWNMLANALGASPEQKKALLDARSGFKQIWALLQKSVSLVSELKSSIQSKNEILSQEMEIIQRILTPKQTAQFILWVTNNPVAMQMLNRVLAKSNEKSVAALSTINS